MRLGDSEVWAFLLTRHFSIKFSLQAFILGLTRKSAPLGGEGGLL
jgi:hypothetical protein